MNSFGRVIAIVAMAVSLAGAVSLGACQRPDDTTSGAAIGIAAPPASAASAAPESSKRFYSLGLVGYNYTEIAVLGYWINGTPGFDLGVSSPDSGGGSTTCCYGWTPATKLPMPIVVEWTRDRKAYCRKTVMLDGPVPLEPTTFEMHLFPDRHIEVAITDKYSPPRLRLAIRPGGMDFRVGNDVRQEKIDGMRLDAQHAECRDGPFPIGELAEREDRERRAKK